MRPGTCKIVIPSRRGERGIPPRYFALRFGVFRDRREFESAERDPSRSLPREEQGEIPLRRLTDRNDREGFGMIAGGRQTGGKTQESEVRRKKKTGAAALPGGFRIEDSKFQIDDERWQRILDCRFWIDENESGRNEFRIGEFRRDSAHGSASVGLLAGTH